MLAEVRLESAEFQRQVVSAAAALGRDLSTVYREEAGRLIQNLMMIRTPPKTQKQGRERVRSDILNTTVPVHEAFLEILDRAYGRGRVSTNYRSRRKKTLKVSYARLIKDMDELRQWHRSQRHSKTGRTPRNARNSGYDAPDKAFIPKQLFNRFVRYQQRGVGTAKGAWWPAARKVYTRRAPGGWITRKSSYGSAVVDFSPGHKQQFVAINRSPWAKRKSAATRAVKDALRQRSRQIPKAVNRALARRYSLAGFVVRGAGAFG